MFTRVVNLLTFKGLLSRVRRGKGKRRDQPRPQNPKPWNLATGCRGRTEPHEPEEQKRFDRRGREQGLAARPLLVLPR